MALPALVHYDTPAEYLNHYQNTYCRGLIQTFDGIRVFFKVERFTHAFYESSNRDGKKDLFSSIRAERIDWIKSTLEHPTATLLEGWDKSSRTYMPNRRVAVVHEEFVVVVVMGLTKDGSLKGNFVTCYQADNSIAKILNSPAWSQIACFKALGGA